LNIFLRGFRSSTS